MTSPWAEAAGSLLGFSSGMSLYASQQAWRTLVAPVSLRDRDDAAAAFDDVAWAIGEELPGAWNQAFVAGDSLQRDVADLAFDSLPDDVLRPGQWMRWASGWLGASADTLRLWFPDREGRLAWQELADKLEVFRLVRSVGRLIGVPGAGEPFDLPALVERAYELTPFQALWAVEGLGHDYALHAWPAEGAPRGLLAPATSDGLPPSSLLMLHAGIGLAFAERRVAPLGPGADDDELDRVVADVVELARTNALPGDIGATWESLGLFTRSFHQQLRAGIDASLRRVAPQVVPYYWHGVGRSLYFLPVNFVPCGRVTWRPFEMARREGPDTAARRGAIAGLAWAITLVTMRQPEVLDHLLLRPHGEELAADDAFANGVASAVMMRWDTTPDAEIVAAFLAHRPRGERGRRWWDELVLRPAETALERWYPVLRRRGRLGEIFRYQDLAALVRGLS